MKRITALAAILFVLPTVAFAEKPDQTEINAVTAVQTHLSAMKTELGTAEQMTQAVQAIINDRDDLKKKLDEANAEIKKLKLEIRKSKFEEQ